MLRLLTIFTLGSLASSQLGYDLRMLFLSEIIEEHRNYRGSHAERAANCIYEMECVECLCSLCYLGNIAGQTNHSGYNDTYERHDQLTDKTAGRGDQALVALAGLPFAVFHGIHHHGVDRNNEATGADGGHGITDVEYDRAGPACKE